MLCIVLLLYCQFNKKTNIDEIINLATQAKINIVGKTIYANDVDVTDSIRSIEVTNKVSAIAKIPEVRTILTQIQQKMAEDKGVVMDGRDIGTTVLPDAKYKFYLTADVEERARRRYEELKHKVQNVSLNKIKEDIIRRDYLDTQRTLSPLAVAKDAIIIDTTDKTITQVVEELLSHVNKGG